MVSPQTRNILFHIFDVVLNIAIIIAVVAIIRTFVVSPFQVEGTSMTETLEDRQYIVINKFRYFFRDPARGDIVVLVPPAEPNKYYVKRVIGLPGDTVTIKDGYVYIRPLGGTKDVKLSEPYLSRSNNGRTFRPDSRPETAGSVSSGDTSPMVYNVPQGSYFVLGDNRQGSSDSRSFSLIDPKDGAFIPQKNIRGSVWFVVLPINNIHAFEQPAYNL